MYKKFIFNITLLILIFCIGSKLVAGEKAIKDSTEINFFSAGIGLMYQINFSHLKGDNYHAFRHFGQFNPFAGFGSNVIPGNYEFSVLIGKAMLFNTKNIGFLSYSTGLSYVQLVRQGKVISGNCRNRNSNSVIAEYNTVHLETESYKPTVII